MLKILQDFIAAINRFKIERLQREEDIKKGNHLDFTKDPVFFSIKINNYPYKSGSSQSIILDQEDVKYFEEKYKPKLVEELEKETFKLQNELNKLK